MEKEVRRMGQKQMRIRIDRKSNRTRQKNKRGDNIEKWDQTESPEIRDRGETSEIPLPPFGVRQIISIKIDL